MVAERGTSQEQRPSLQACSVYRQHGPAGLAVQRQATSASQAAEALVKGGLPYRVIHCLDATAIGGLLNLLLEVLTSIYDGLIGPYLSGYPAFSSVETVAKT